MNCVCRPLLTRLSLQVALALSAIVILGHMYSFVNAKQPQQAQFTKLPQYPQGQQMTSFTVAQPQQQQQVYHHPASVQLQVQQPEQPKTVDPQDISTEVAFH